MEKGLLEALFPFYSMVYIKVNNPFNLKKRGIALLINRKSFLNKGVLRLYYFNGKIM